MVRTLAVAAIALVTLVTSMGSADAASVRFRGNISTFSPGLTTNGGADPLGLTGLGSSTFEIAMTTNDAGTVTGSYMVFLGTSFNIASGTVAANTISGIGILTAGNVATGQTMSINIPGLVGDGQANFDAVIGVNGNFQIVGGGLQYFGNITAIPEPSAMLALVGGVGCLALRRRKVA